MQICIHRNVLGESKHFLYDKENEKFKWVNQIPDDSWVFGDENAKFSIDQLSLLMEKEISKFPNEPYKTISKNLLKTDKDIKFKWRYMLPAHVFKEFIHELLRRCVDASISTDGRYYTDIFYRTSGLLKSLERAYINEEKLYELYSKEKNETVKSTLKTFFPETDGFAKNIVYDQFSTVTGRLTVKSGPRILTLSKKYRSIISSSYEGGIIGSIDFSSIEPRLALLHVNHKTPEDIYTDIANNVFNGEKTRDVIKLITIATLYGAKEETMKKISGLSGNELFHVVEQIQKYFGIRTIKAKLIKEYNEFNYIKNVYGKKIFSKKSDPNILYNHFNQSSAVDVALLGFSNAVELIKKNNWLIKPLFIIHDDLIIDVHPDFFQYINDIEYSCMNIPKYDEKFYVKFKEIK